MRSHTFSTLKEIINNYYLINIIFLMRTCPSLVAHLVKQTDILRQAFHRRNNQLHNGLLYRIGRLSNRGDQMEVRIPLIDGF